MKNLKIYTSLFLFFFVITTQAQLRNKTVSGNGNVITKTIKTTDYDKIAVAGIYFVTLVEGEEGQITIKGEENLLEVTIIEVNGNSLVIKTENNINLKPSRNNKIEVLVPVQSVSVISLAGSGDIRTENLNLKSEDMEVSLAGSGDIKLVIETSNLLTKVAGSGDIELAGKATILTGKLAGSGDLNLFNLSTEKADVSIAGSGDIMVLCTEDLKARIAGSGDIVYKGNPRIKDTKTAGSGSIKSF
ncbi:MAG: DUF2807 domain-containing protein [Flavobacteriaceae bacterium CG_4_8_14_3_um_filter_34_10]|nr:MAG: DUF2807 domain-containing protein [Flavobacteriaceae bacterium CG_4_8_14_3_um_filter_34_10]